MNNKKIYTLPYIQINSNSFKYWEREPGISFNELKRMLGIDLLEFKKIGASILINNKHSVTLNFKHHWIIFNNEPFLTNIGAFILFRDCKKIYPIFLKKYEKFYCINYLSMKLNEILTNKKKDIEKEIIYRKEKRLQLKQLEEDSFIYLDYIKEFIPNFNNKKALANNKLAKASI